MENEPILYVNMLGKFSMSYNGQPVSFKRNTATNAMKLLQILLHAPGMQGGGVSPTPALGRTFRKRRFSQCGKQPEGNSTPIKENAVRYLPS